MARTRKKSSDNETQRPRLWPEPALQTCVWGYDKPMEDIRQRVTAGRLPHALLLCGPQGVGKATWGYHLARYLLHSSEERLWPLPENDALIHRMAEGSHPDFLALTSSSGSVISMETVRDALAFLTWRHGESDARVILIDDVDSLSRSGVNALLKTLEEPPAGTYLILISHAWGALPATLRSRCYPVRCCPLEHTQLDDVLARLDHIASHEHALYKDFSEGHLGRLEALYAYGGGEWPERWRALFDAHQADDLVMTWADQAHQDQDFFIFLHHWMIYELRKKREMRTHTDRYVALEQEIVQGWSRQRALKLDRRQTLLYSLNRIRSIVTP